MREVRRSAQARQRCRLSVPVGQVDGGEGQVARIVRERRRRALAGLLRRFRPGNAGCERAQAIQLPIRQHPGGGFVRRAENSVGSFLLVAQGGEGEGDVGLFQIAAALQRHHQVLFARGLARRQRVFEALLENRLPDLLPDHRHRTAERGRMAGRAADRDEGVVVEVDELGADGERGWEARVEDDPHGVAPAFRPFVDRPERCRCPIELAKPRGHFAADSGRPGLGRRSGSVLIHAPGMLHRSGPRRAI